MSEIPNADWTWINTAAERFEGAWRDGQSPRIEDYLAEVDELRRARLFDELLRVEIELRRANGETPSAEDYRGRFPEHSPVIDALFGREHGAVRSRSGAEPDGTPGFESSVIRGALAGIAETTESVPRVLLRDTDSEFGEPVVRPSSTEMPADTGRYQLLGEIGHGGMGAVLKGRDPDLGRDLAVKVLLEEHRNTPDLLSRFIEEAQIGGQLQHPGIVPVYELGSFGDRRPYFTMKLVKGRTLATLLSERGRVSAPSSNNPTPGADATGLAVNLPRFLGIFEQVCQTVAYAHARGVIHRDLKPSNIMVGSFGEVQVMDWGLAKVLPQGGTADESREGTEEAAISVIRTVRSGSDADASRAGWVLGTPAYMAPEQARGEIEIIDERADVFGLGSILCEILTGQPAYTGQSRLAIARKAERGDTADALRRLAGCGADAELVALAKDCLACDFEDRLRDAGAVARRITAHLAGVQERLRLAELAQVEAHARAEEEAKRRVLSDQLAAEAEARAEEAGRRVVVERQRRRYQLGLAASVLALTVLAGLSLTYWAQERQARVARAGLFLREATVLRNQAAAAPEDVNRWEAAAKGVEAASNALVGGAEAETMRRLAALRKEVQSGLVAARRDQNLLDALAGVRTSKQELGKAGASAAYARAFRDAGFDVDTASPNEVGAALKARPPSVAVAAAAALDDWALALSGGKRSAAAVAVAIRRPLEVARVADPDPFRDKVRAALLEPNNNAREALRKLAADPKAAELAPPSAVLLASAVRDLVAVEPAVVLLRAVVGRHPDDFWANYVLADAMSTLRPPAREEAVRYYTAARSLLPEVAHNLAHLLDKMGRADEALAVFADLASRRPDDPHVLADYGRCLKNRGRREAAAILNQAAGAARAAIRLKPDDGEAHHELGKVLSAQGKFDEAIVEYKHAIRIGPHGDAHADLGAILCEQKHDFDAAIAEFREAIRLQPERPDFHCNLGVAYSNQGKYDAAIPEYRAAIGIAPDHAPSHGGLGKALARQGKLEQALAEFRTAIRLRPDFNVYFDLGYALFRAGKLDDAIAAYGEAIRLKPDVAEAHQNLGFALEKRGNLEEAIAEYRKAIELKPDSAEIHILLGMLLCDRKHDYDGAIAEFRAAIRIKPEEAVYHYNLGNAFNGRGDLELETSEFRAAIRINPNLAQAHCNLARALRDTGNYTESLAEYRKGHELGSNQPGWHYPSAQWVAEAERLAAVAARLPAVLRGDDKPKDTADRLALGQIAYHRKQFAAAARLWSDALAADPKLVDDRESGHRYDAACAAALAAAGQGEDNPPPTDEARAKLRQQALDWLKAERDAWAKLLETGKPEARAAIVQTLVHWQADPDLVSVRDLMALSKLPEADQKAWRSLWEEVDALLNKARGAGP
ncbi:MAG: tetratricopeptide repeat protein [Isosphaeraceae bacterium]